MILLPVTCPSNTNAILLLTILPGVHTEYSKRGVVPLCRGLNCKRVDYLFMRLVRECAWRHDHKVNTNNSICIKQLQNENLRLPLLLDSFFLPNHSNICNKLSKKTFAVGKYYIIFYYYFAVIINIPKQFLLNLKTNNFLIKLDRIYCNFTVSIWINVINWKIL